MSAILNPVPSPQPSGPSKAPSPVVEPRQPSRAWLWLVILAVVAAGGYWLWNAQQAQQQQQAAAAGASLIKTARVTEGSLAQLVRVTGQTSAKDFSNVTIPKLTGPEGNRPLVLLWLIKSGTPVKKGEKLASIDVQSMQDHIDDVHSTVLQAESDIKKRKAEQLIEWESLQLQLKQSQANLDKLKLDSSAAEVRTAIDQELIKLNVEEAEAQVRELKADMEQKKVSMACDIRLLELTHERHVRHRDRHKTDLLRFEITAAMDGLAVIQNVFRGGEFSPIQQGDQVYSGQTIMKVVRPNSMQVEGNISQANSNALRVGQTADVSFDAFPGLQLKGHVYSIGALAVASPRSNNYIRNIPVRVQIDGVDPRLIPDLSAAADVKLSQSDKGTIVPLAATATEGGKTVVYVKQGGKFLKRDIELTFQNETHGIVKAGLAPGDEVALNYQLASR
jgi:membrane fusion protein (multidrug efflux system)